MVIHVKKSCFGTDPILAIQTYRQEVADHFNELDEDRRRLVVRGDIKQWNSFLRKQRTMQESLQMKNLRFSKMPGTWDYMAV